MTLVEVVFVSGLLGLFVLMVAKALVMGFRAHQRTMDRTYYYRQGAVALSRMAREMNVCFFWSTPAIGSGVQHPIADGDLIWTRTTPGFSPAGDPAQLQEVRYWRDAIKGELVRKDSSIPGGSRVVVKEVTDFTVEIQPGQVKATLSIKNNAVPLVVIAQPIRM